MNLRAFGRPSIAKEFFLKITGDSDPIAAIKRLLNATPPTFETEWLDFKGAAQTNDQDTKKTWSKALAGFANTQGGVHQSIPALHMLCPFIRPMLRDEPFRPQVHFAIQYHSQYDDLADEKPS
jgi:hypothetical protein